MTPLIDDTDFVLHVGDALETLRAMPDESVHCCITSPPYWGLRDYGTGSWEGGDEGCDHLVRDDPKVESSTLGGGKGTTGHQREGFKAVCPRCGARRVDNQLGLEPTPEEYVANMVAVFREVRRVLRRDGTCWLNIGDSYAGSSAMTTNEKALKGKQGTSRGTIGEARATEVPLGLKPKDLVGIPWKLAQALQAPYYTGRISAERDRVWLAATLDAEGTICGFSHDRKDEGGRTRTGLIFNITNSSEALLAEAMRIWPSALHRHLRNGPGHLGKREVWRWHVNGIENKTALVRELYPYLIVKRTQALLAYNLLLLMADAKRLGHSSQRDSVREKRALLVRLLSDANHERHVDVPSWCVAPSDEGMWERGWFLRSEIIWAKLCPTPCLNPSLIDPRKRTRPSSFLRKNLGTSTTRTRSGRTTRCVRSSASLRVMAKSRATRRTVARTGRLGS